MDQTTIVSVIIPVYQVEEYLDQCIQSVVDQTYHNIEVLLITKKGADRSYDICLDWEKRDDRIRVIEQMGNGLGDARNLGVEEATGEYICFVDSDDWLDEQYVEEMINCIQKGDADIAECEFWEYRSETEIKQSENCFLYKLFDQETAMIYGAPAAWKLLSKRSFWIESGVRYPDTPAEDLAIYMLLFSLHEKIAHVGKPLYYYRIRSDSMSYTWYSASEHFDKMLEVYRIIVEEHKKRGLFLKREKAILLEVTADIRGHITAFQRRLGKETGAEALRKAKNFVFAQFGETIFQKQFKFWGGYNLGRIGNMVSLEPPEENRYSFSSLISLMSEPDTTVRITHKNAYRETALQREAVRSFRQKEILENTDYILLDFLEERFDMIQSGDAYYTKSDAFDESENNIRIDRIIKRDSEECRMLFQKACKDFMNALADYPRIKVILFENYLCERKGKLEETSEFENIDEIRATNNLLKECYDFFKKEYPDVPVIRMERQDLNYTDEDFRYGCYPWHMNRYAYISIGQQLKDYMMTD